MTDSDADISELARQVVDELDPGSTIGDKIVLSRRQLVAIAGGGLSAGALATLGVSEAEAQTAAGQVGTSTEPVDVQAATVTAQALEAGRIDISDRIMQSGDAVGPGITTGAIRDVDNTTSMTYVTVSISNGFIDGSRVPPGASLYANVFARLDNNTNGETVSVVPSLSGVGDLTSVELTKTSTSDGVDFTNETTGWTEVTESIPDVAAINSLRAKVSGGEATFSVGCSYSNHSQPTPVK